MSVLLHCEVVQVCQLQRPGLAAEGTFLASSTSLSGEQMTNNEEEQEDGGVVQWKHGGQSCTEHDFSA